MQEKLVLFVNKNLAHISITKHLLHTFFIFLYHTLSMILQGYLKKHFDTPSECLDHRFIDQEESFLPFSSCMYVDAT